MDFLAGTVGSRFRPGSTPEICVPFTRRERKQALGRISRTEHECTGLSGYRRYRGKAHKWNEEVGAVLVAGRRFPCIGRKVVHRVPGENGPTYSSSELGVHVRNFPPLVHRRGSRRRFGEGGPPAFELSERGKSPIHRFSSAAVSKELARSVQNLMEITRR